MMDLTEIAASLTPEERKAAPRAWVENPAGMNVKVIDPNWLRRFALRRAGLPGGEEPVSLTPAGRQKRIRPNRSRKAI